MTSARICGPGRSVCSKSQLQASKPTERKASRTIPLNSHATSTFTTPPFALCRSSLLFEPTSQVPDSNRQDHHHAQKRSQVRFHSSWFAYLPASCLKA